MNSAIENHRSTVEKINEAFIQLSSLSNDELRHQLKLIEDRVNSSKSTDEVLSDRLVMVYAIAKETARRFSNGNVIVKANDYDRYLADNYDFVSIDGDNAIYKNKWDVCGMPFQWNMIHYDEQLLGGILLHFGYAIEMATGEGKTLVATLPVFLNALTHKGVHLMTVNDYLSKRDFELTRPIYMFHGLRAGCIEYTDEYDNKRKDAYSADISFGSISTFTFDYLRDHLAVNPNDCVQRDHHYAVIDELDSVLIDNADEPHIIGGGNFYNEGKIYAENLPIVQELINSNEHESLYIHIKDYKIVYYTDKGKDWLSQKTGISDLYAVTRTYQIDNFESLDDKRRVEIKKNIRLQNVFYQLLRALICYERDIDYVVTGDRVKIIDPHTGRIKETSRWEYGLHTAIEVKENVPVRDDFDSLATISLKNYFKLYDKICGMSGTIMPVEDELAETYGLRCAQLPTHKPVLRVDEPLKVYRTVSEKDAAIIDYILEKHKSGRPILVGNTTLKRSDHISNLIENRGLMFNKLDARTTKEEARIVAKAGIGDSITVSTSVAGRGTDIKPSEDAIACGGLCVIGTDIFDSVRIDRQLRGRSGRQGNPGTSVFFVSLQDSILNYLSEEDKIAFHNASEKMKDRQEGMSSLSVYFEKAQSEAERFFRRCRDEIARKDDIVAPHRRRFYTLRNKLLFDGSEANSLVVDIVKSRNIPLEDVDVHLKELYAKSLEILSKNAYVNPNLKKDRLPFADHLHLYTILLDIESTRNSFVYFRKEFQRQVVLHAYDKLWKQFVIYMMGNLDRKEEDLLEDKYRSTMDEADEIILSRLLYSTIPLGNNQKSSNESSYTPECQQQVYKNTLNPDSPCPCGSKKKYCECHGRNIRSIIKPKRRI